MSPIQTRARARRENILLPGYLSSNPKPTSTSSNRFKHTTAISAKRFKINSALEHGQPARVALADRTRTNRVREANTKRAPRHARYYPELRIWPVDDYQYPAAAPLRTAPKVRWAEDIEYNEYSPGDQGDQELVNGYSDSEMPPPAGNSKPSAEEASDGNTGKRAYVGRTPPGKSRRIRAHTSPTNFATVVLFGKTQELSRLEVDDASRLDHPATPSYKSTATDRPSPRYRATPHPGLQSSSWSSSSRSPAATQHAGSSGALEAQDIPISGLGLRPHLPPALVRPGVSKGWRGCLADFIDRLLLKFAVVYVFVVFSFFGRMYGIW